MLNSHKNFAQDSKKQAFAPEVYPFSPSSKAPWDCGTDCWWLILRTWTELCQNCLRNENSVRVVRKNPWACPVSRHKLNPYLFLDFEAL